MGCAFPMSHNTEESLTKQIANLSLSLPRAPDDDAKLDARFYKKLIEENIDVSLQVKICSHSK